ncbi:hypothetical protein GCM10027515_15140 [Schumannella luteola]|uniref:DUF1453 domain-containing protein n=1 Tax=Schumannella luteola TaxID=472059 RepID=A0A852YCH9_9MICO|nr:hypothetical protein [Schumannella luteola]NYH00687.1 hypothetical protein [Schumannella luteola]TPX02465.1 hypothetical protein FJ656_22195 [Schumannella luteola]
MTAQNLISIALGLALVVYIGYRQSTWQNLTARSNWLMPAILGVVGLGLLVKSTPAAAFTAQGLGLLLLELALSLAIGVVMGVITRFRSVDGHVVDRRGQVIEWQTRTGWVGAALFFALIAVRIGIDVWAGSMGFGALVASTGAILLVIGANRLVRAGVIQMRLARHQELTGVGAA